MNSNLSKTAGIILAAGSGLRMGCTKQLLLFKNLPALSIVINRAKLSRLDPIIVVLGHQKETIESQVDLTGTLKVYNPDYKLGQSSSLIKGISMVPKNCKGAMFLLADQPLIDVLLIDQLIRAFENNDKPIIIPRFKGKRGNPVIIAKSLFPQILKISGDTGARVLFEKNRELIHFESVTSDFILLDMDNEDEYQRLTQIFSSSN